MVKTLTVLTHFSIKNHFIGQITSFHLVIVIPSIGPLWEWLLYITNYIVTHTVLYEPYLNRIWIYYGCKSEPVKGPLRTHLLTTTSRQLRSLNLCIYLLAVIRTAFFGILHFIFKQIITYYYVLFRCWYTCIVLTWNI